MRALATFIAKGRGQAAVAVAVLTILSWAISLVSLLSAAAVGLATLRKGAFEGAIIILAALPIVALVGWIVLGTPLQAIGYALILWGPIWLVAILLRESGRLALASIGAAGLGLVMVAVIYSIHGDPATMWQEEWQRLFEPLLRRQTPDADTEAFRQSFADFARYLTGLLAAGLVLALTLSLFIARWWQALLFNPGGFRTEFLSLRMPTALAYLWLGLLGLAWLAINGSDLAANLSIPLFVPFLLAGLAVLHAWLSGYASGGFWLIGIYLLIFASPLSVMVMLIGLSDVWMDWRRRLSKVAR